jgi:hypothetical protein
MFLVRLLRLIPKHLATKSSHEQPDNQLVHMGCYLDRCLPVGILGKEMKPTQEQVIAWAREAGATRDHPEHLPDIWTMDTEGFLQFATLAYEAGRKDENEACAKYLEAKDDGIWANHCAIGIRGRR